MIPVLTQRPVVGNEYWQPGFLQVRSSQPSRRGCLIGPSSTAGRVDDGGAYQFGPTFCYGMRVGVLYLYVCAFFAISHSQRKMFLLIKDYVNSSFPSQSFRPRDGSVV